jgi:Na+-transporting NADH:ubiquinone oxidoreductase subunit C
MAERTSAGVSAGNAGGWLQRIREAPVDSPARTLAVAIAVCLTCSVVVSTAAVLLRPLQLANQAGERNQQIVAILEGLPGIGDLVGEIDVRNIEVQVIDLDTGEVDETIDPRTYDQRQAAADAEGSVELPDDRDIAGLGRRARWATVYTVREDGAVWLLILPVSGEGFQSTLYGYLALDGDLNTIQALSFYEHGETPGLGAEVEDPQWQAQWKGKKVRDPEGTLRVRVASGNAETQFEVDGISGATYTGDGVTKLLRFWLGPDGFGPYLEHFKREGERP